MISSSLRASGPSQMPKARVDGANAAKQLSACCRVPGGDEVLAIGQSDGMLALHATGAEALEEPRALGITPASIIFSARGMPASSDHRLDHAQSVNSMCTLQGVSAWAE